MVAVVTGASGGIGSEIALALAAIGYDVALIYNSNEAAAMAVADEVTAKGGKACAYKCDLQKPWEIADTASKILDDFGGVDLIVNNAGIAMTGLVTDFDADDFDKIFNINVRSMFLLNNALLPNMINKKSGCIINISSIWGISGASCEVLYSAAKAAVIGYTKALACELGPSGIRVNAIAPG
ncbi:MAG: SDR family NAD(P)-dependent oxidoreductase, partial [Acutalibacteraceae bacterium]